MRSAVCGVLPTAYCLLLTACCLLALGCATSTLRMGVVVPVVDLRATPRTAPQPNTHDPDEETQLLYGERVRILRTRDGWTYVEAVEQPEWTHHRRWQGYPGWVPAAALAPWEALPEPTIVVAEKWAPTWTDAFAAHLSPWRFALGTRLRATEMGGHLWKVELLDGTIVWMPRRSAEALGELRALTPAEQRRRVVQNAALFIGDPYFWGGRSPAGPEPTAPSPEPREALGPLPLTGVDCSGLVNLAYRAAGIDIPRDAHEQFLRAQSVKTLQPADLIFLSDASNPRRIVHVMLYAGDGEVIEGPGTGLAVRRIAIAKRLGQLLDSLMPGSVVNGQTVFFGTYLPNNQ